MRHASGTARAYRHLAANATTILKTGPGNLSMVTINTRGALSNTATLYDGLSAAGAVIAVIDTTAGVGGIPYDDLPFLTGLTIVIATGTAPDLTVQWA